MTEIKNSKPETVGWEYEEDGRKNVVPVGHLKQVSSGKNEEELIRRKDVLKLIEKMFDNEPMDDSWVPMDDSWVIGRNSALRNLKQKIEEREE